MKDPTSFLAYVLYAFFLAGLGMGRLPVPATACAWTLGAALVLAIGAAMPYTSRWFVRRVAKSAAREAIEKSSAWLCVQENGGRSMFDAETGYEAEAYGRIAVLPDGHGPPMPIPGYKPWVEFKRWRP